MIIWHLFIDNYSIILTIVTFTCMKTSKSPLIINTDVSLSITRIQDKCSLCTIRLEDTSQTQQITYELQQKLKFIVKKTARQFIEEGKKKFMNNLDMEVINRKEMRGVDNPAMTEDDGDVSHGRPDLVISVQPQSVLNRAQLPVSTEGWQSNPRGQFIPTHGLDFLIGVSSLQIQQTVELDDLVSKIDSENRYIVRVPNGEALYIASEASSSTQRCLCGSGRAFTMHLHDNTRQEAMVLQRRLAGSSCLFPCRLQEMKVITPPGDYVGRVQQRCTWMVPVFHVRDATDQLLFVIEGPAVLQRSALMLSEFKLMTADALREVGKICHGWDRELVSFATTLQMPDNAVQPRHKCLLLAAAFLLEYTYFERSKVKCCRGWCSCFR